MITPSFTPDKIWYKSLLQGIDELGGVVVGMVLSNFDKMLKAAPQRYGYYVASFRISVNGQAAPPADRDTFGPPRSRKNFFYRGCMDAIEAARAANRGAKGLAMAGSSGMSIPHIAVYNPVSYADEAESHPGRKAGWAHSGDPGNRVSSGHVAKFQNDMDAILAKRLYVQKGMWHTYLGTDL